MVLGSNKADRMHLVSNRLLFQDLSIASEACTGLGLWTAVGPPGSPSAKPKDCKDPHARSQMQATFHSATRPREAHLEHSRRKGTSALNYTERVALSAALLAV